MTPPHRKPQDIVDDINQFITHARLLLEKNQMLALTGLDSNVAQLCQEVLALPAGERLEYAEILDKLMVDLTRLGQQMEVEKNSVLSEIQGVGSFQKASTAYRATDAIDGKSNQDQS